jgi:hypothetical protein
MKRRSSLVLLLLTASLCGCASFHIPFIGKKGTKPPVQLGPKDSSQVATDTERDFMHRWVDKRAAELVAQGQASDAAHAQAQSEFAQRFPTLGILQQK